MICTDNDGLTWQEAIEGSSTRTELIGEPCVGTFELKDLEEDPFFEITDVKPGDQGENTISLHVFDNDAWGQIEVTNIVDNDESCNEPEVESGDPECTEVDEDLDNEAGELSDNMDFFVWLDQGFTPGFQCADPDLQDECEDTEEGDNIFQPDSEALDVDPFNPFDGSIILDLGAGLGAAYSQYGCTEADGHTDYGNCHGLAEDGRLVGSATYYLGVAWCIGEADGQGNCDGSTVGNDVQTDSLTSDIRFDITQHRNQDNPYPTPTP